MQYAFRY